jgi:nucleoid-associated protein YgaU
LKATGDSGAKAQSLAAELEQTKSDLALARAQLGDAQKGVDGAKAEAAGDKAALEKQVGDLTARLAASTRNYSLLQQENSLLRRSAPLRPSAVAAALAAAPAPTPTPVPVRTHVIVDGDTLTKISLEYYGTAGRWQAIYEANRDTLPNESTLTIGNTIRIP